MRVEFKTYWLTDERSKVDVDRVADWLNTSYWAAGRSKEVVLKSVAGSTCISVFDGDQQIGFARAVTDGVTFAWIADVFVDPDYRGQGIGKQLMQTLLGHADVAGTESQYLRTADAHELYRRYGFQEAACMRRKKPTG